MPGQRQIEARWGVPFWQLVADFADQGLPRSDVAKALGYHRDGFYDLLTRNPHKDPFDSSNIVAAYVRESGESFRAALERMAAAGMSKTAAAVAIGYADSWSLGRAMVARGVIVKFTPALGRPRIHPLPVERGPNVSSGWPSWSQVYEMTPDLPVSTTERRLKPGPAQPQRS